MSRKAVAGIAASSILGLMVILCIVFNVGNVRNGFSASSAYYSIADGNWENPQSWSTSGFSGKAGTGYPKAGDVVYIEDHNITVTNADAACSTITVQNSGATLTVQSGKQLNLSSDLNLNAVTEGKGSATLNVKGSGTKLNVAGVFRVTKSGGAAGVSVNCEGTSQINASREVSMNYTGGNSDINISLNDYAQFNITGNLNQNYSGGAGSIAITLNDNSQLTATNVNYNSSLSGRTSITLNKSSVANISGNINRYDSNKKNGSLNSNDSSQINFTGSTAQTLAAASGGDTIYMNNFVVNNKSLTSPQVTLQSNVYVTGTMTLTAGIVKTSSTARVILADGAVLSGGSPSSFVSGPLEKRGTDAFLFPVGKGTKYAPISISAPNTATNFVAEYFNTPYVDLESKVASVGSISKKEYWELKRASGTGSVNVTLHWKDANWSGIKTPANVKVAHYDASRKQWTDAGNNGYTSLADAGNITSDKMTSFSPFTFGGDGLGALPVSLLNFDVKASGSTVTSSWATAAEINNDHFELQRSSDGVNFTAVDNIPGHGTTLGRQNYEYEDKDPLPGLSYYRLKQIDFNGKFEIFKVKTVNLSQGTIESVSPNPFTDHFNMEYRMQNEGDVLLQIVNMQGSSVYEERLHANRGINSYQYHDTGLKTGNYLLRLVIGNEVQTFKLVKY